jgi:hypothetical protein
MKVDVLTFVLEKTPTCRIILSIYSLDSQIFMQWSVENKSMINLHLSIWKCQNDAILLSYSLSTIHI